MRNGLFQASFLAISGDVRAALTDPQLAAEAAALLPDSVRTSLALYCYRRPPLLETATAVAALCADDDLQRRDENDGPALIRQRHDHRETQDLTLCVA